MSGHSGVPGQAVSWKFSPFNRQTYVTAAAAVLVAGAGAGYYKVSLSLILGRAGNAYRSRWVCNLHGSIDALGSADSRTAVLDVTEPSGVVGNTSAAVSLCITSLNAVFKAGVLKHIWQETAGEQTDGHNLPCETRLT